jgi:predicted RecA/RadA family phage recombinase
MFGVSPVTAAAGVQIALWLVGCFTMNKNAAEAWTVGQRIYWDSVNARCTTNSTGGNTKIGVAVAAARLAASASTACSKEQCPRSGPNRRRCASLASG